MGVLKHHHHNHDSHTHGSHHKKGKSVKFVEDGGKEEEKKSYKSNLPLTAFNVTNSMLGAGIVVMPFTIMESGFGLGIVLLIVVAALTDYSLCLLIHAGELSHKFTYSGSARVAFGMCGQGFVLLLAFLYPVVIMTGYNIIIGDNVSKLLIRVTNAGDIDDLRSNWWGRRDVLILFVVFGTLLPLSLYKNIAKLAKWSTLAIVTIFLIIALMAIKLVELDLPDEPGAYTFAKFDALQAFGLLASAFFCHHSSFIMFNSMKHPTERRWDEVVHISVFVSLFVVLIVGILGYATFTENAQGDILENYCYHDDMINAARFLFILTLIFSFPIELFVARNVIESMFWPETSTLEAPLSRHFILTFLIVAATYGLSLITECLGIVLEIAGLLFAVPMAYLIPPMMVIKLSPHPVCHWKNIPRFFMILIALGVLGGGWYETIRELIEEGVTCSEGQEPDYCSVNGTLI